MKSGKYHTPMQLAFDNGCPRSRDSFSAPTGPQSFVNRRQCKSVQTEQTHIISTDAAIPRQSYYFTITLMAGDRNCTAYTREGTLLLTLLTCMTRAFFDE